MHSLLADELFGQVDPAILFHAGMARELSSEGHATTIRIRAPFVKKDEISLKQAGEELVVTVGEVRRTIMLPSGLAQRDPSRAAFEDGILEIEYDHERPVGQPDD
jgi:arsenite-transporting ATPase